MLLKDKDKKSTVARKVIRIGLMLVLIIIALIILRLAEYYRKTDTTPFKFSRLADYALTLISPNPAFAEDKPSYVFEDGLVFYQAGELAMSKARDVFMVTQDPGHENFLKLVDAALKDYSSALYIWTTIYKSISDEDKKRSLEKAQLLDSINKVLWRMLPHLKDAKLATDTKEAMNRNWKDVLGIMDSQEKNSGLRKKFAQNFELFRRRQQEEKKRQNQGQPQEKGNPESLNFPQESETDLLKGQEGSIDGKKLKAKEKMKAERKERGEEGGKGEDPKIPEAIEGVPSLGVFPLPSISP